MLVKMKGYEAEKLQNLQDLCQKLKRMDFFCIFIEKV